METPLHCAVTHFFQVVGQVYEAACVIYDDASAQPGCMIMEHGLIRDLSTKLVSIVELLEAITVDDKTAALIRACRKVSLDLLIRLNKLLRLHTTARAEDATVEIAVFRSTWPEADVDALGSRLRELTSQWKGNDPSST